MPICLTLDDRSLTPNYFIFHPTKCAQKKNQFQQMMQPPSMAQMQQQAGSQVNVQDLLKPQMDLLPSMNDAQAQQAQQFRQATPGQSTGSNMGEQQLAQTGTDAKFTSVPGVPMQSNVGGLSAAVGMYHPYVNPFLFPLAPHKCVNTHVCACWQSSTMLHFIIYAFTSPTSA